MEEIVSFRNKNGERLVGIVNIPDSGYSQSRVGIILLNTGLNYRVAWHRLSVKIARKLCKEGYYVLRFDTHGIGDSEGEIEKGNIVQHFLKIEKGAFYEDTLDSLNFFISEKKLNKVFLIGLCGGALTGVFAAIRDKRINGLVDIAGPITLSSIEHLEKKHPWEIWNTLMFYLPKLISFKGWKRFFMGKSDYYEIMRLIKNMAITIFSKKNKTGQFNGMENNLKIKAWERLNLDFIKAFDNYYNSGRKILFIFADRDPATWEFKKLFLNDHLKTKNYRQNYEYYEIKDTNHIFSCQKSQEILTSLVEKWLANNIKNCNYDKR